ncbi:hypothetical protein [Weissella confusa]|uniref:Uncharacterized protein n=1 Tax=Weissella confusa TaxID=1583 RepID=A0AA40YNJ6_WEICO|nr:hypothetical protein [Weissella confusa]MBJ7637919.1 hypothetical protein [Weissella confusa]
MSGLNYNFAKEVQSAVISNHKATLVDKTHDIVWQQTVQKREANPDWSARKLAYVVHTSVETVLEIARYYGWTFKKVREPYVVGSKKAK